MNLEGYDSICGMRLKTFIFMYLIQVCALIDLNNFFLSFLWYCQQNFTLLFCVYEFQNKNREIKGFMETFNFNYY